MARLHSFLHAIHNLTVVARNVNYSTLASRAKARQNIFYLRPHLAERCLKLNKRLKELMDDIYVLRIKADSYTDTQQKILPTSGEISQIREDVTAERAGIYTAVLRHTHVCQTLAFLLCPTCFLF